MSAALLFPKPPPGNPGPLPRSLLYRSANPPPEPVAVPVPALGPALRDVHPQRSSPQGVPVKTQRALQRGKVLKLQEIPARPVRVPVPHHAHVRDGARVRGEKPNHFVLGALVREVPHERGERGGRGHREGGARGLRAVLVPRGGPEVPGRRVLGVVSLVGEATRGRPEVRGSRPEVRVVAVDGRAHGAEGRADAHYGPRADRPARRAKPRRSARDCLPRHPQPVPWRAPAAAAAVPRVLLPAR